MRVFLLKRTASNTKTKIVFASLDHEVVIQKMNAMVEERISELDDFSQKYLKMTRGISYDDYKFDYIKMEYPLTYEDNRIYEFEEFYEMEEDYLPHYVLTILDELQNFKSTQL